MNLQILKSILFALILPFCIPLLGQTVQQEKMDPLSFMVGEWLGTSTTYDSGKVTQQVPAFQEIEYDLNQSILVIKLNSSTLKLHTIIHYSVKDSTYYYTAFSEKGGGKLPATFSNSKFVVHASENRRYIFERYGADGFREYGEKRINGVWVKYFEDVFTDTK